MEMEEKSYQENVLEVEPYGIEPIPQKERHGHPRQMFTIWFAINLNVVSWFTGFLGIEFGLSLKYAILAILIGNVFGAFCLGMISTLGPELGQPLIPASKKAMGKAGVFGLSFLSLINNIGWLAVNLVLAIMALQKIVPLSYHLSLLVLTAATLLVAIYGYNFIHSFAHWMSIIVGVLFLIMSVITVQNLPEILAQAGPNTAGGFSLGMFILTIAVAFSYQISYCPIGADYARYLPANTSKRKILNFSFWGACSVCIWLEILGALTASLGMHTGPMDFFAQLMGAFTIPALITIILSILPVNAMAMYSGGLAALTMGLPLKRWTSALLIACLGALSISFGHGELSSMYENFLLLLSYWIAPWVGVILCDFYYRKVHPELQNVTMGWQGVGAFICGVAVSIPFMSSVLYTGPLATYLGGADISYFLSLCVSSLLYSRALKTKTASRTVSGSLPISNEK
ncbi:cytosine permease [Bacillota bacterium LX-D]|nr:cytosine permease [Bacillota bacterium LX-D]